MLIMDNLSKVLDFVKSEQKRAKKGFKMWGWIGASSKSFYRGAITFLENIEDFIEIEKITKREINTKINFGTIKDLNKYKYTIENFNVDLRLCKIDITTRSINQEKNSFTIDLLEAKEQGIIDITFLNKLLK
jgi:hypothetical protein